MLAYAQFTALFRLGNCSLGMLHSLSFFDNVSVRSHIVKQFKKTVLSSIQKYAKAELQNNFCSFRRVT